MVAPRRAVSGGGGGGGAGGASGANKGAQLTAHDSAYECESVLTATAWHPKDHSRLLLLLRAGAEVTLQQYLSLHHAPPLAWSVDGALTFASRQQQLLSVLPSDAPFAQGVPLGRLSRGPSPSADDGGGGRYADDILACMRARAKAGYGLVADRNLALLSQPWASSSPNDQAQLLTAWRWLARAGAASAGDDALLGAMGVLRGPQRGGGRPSESSESASGLRVFQSAGRLRLVQSFGWVVCTEPFQLESTIANLESAGEYERAALMALFQSGAHAAYNELGRAVRCLERGGAASAAAMPTRASDLRMMAMVLAGYQPHAPLWWSTVHATAASLSSPHLKLLLAVLCSPSSASFGARRLDASEPLAGGGSYFGSGSDSPLSSPDSSTADLAALVEADDGESRDAFVVRASEGDGHHPPGSWAGADAAAATPLAGHGHSSVLLEQVVMEAMLEDGAAMGGGVPGEGEALSEGSAPHAELFTDALAMACRFLPDPQLGSLLRKLVASATELGSLGALCLTGLGTSSVRLLQAYIDRTADVQTAVLLCAKGTTPALLQHPRFRRWKGIYADLLNRWQHYHERCTIDIAVAARLRHTAATAAGGGVGGGGGASVSDGARPSSGSADRSPTSTSTPALHATGAWSDATVRVLPAVSSARTRS